MADFRTPLAAHRAAFARIGPTFDLPPAGRDALRQRFQAAERNGDPQRIKRDVGEVVGDYIWGWPWYDEWASRFQAQGVWPRAWERLKIAAGTAWSHVPHNPRVELVCWTLGVAAYGERDRARRDVETFIYTLARNDPECAAEAMVFASHEPQFRAGNADDVPPFFPGDALRVEAILRRWR